MFAILSHFTEKKCSLMHVMRCVAVNTLLGGHENLS